MTDPTTTNRGYFVPVTGTDIDTWGPILNANFAAIDTNLGGVNSIAVSNVDIVLTPTQYASGSILFSGTQTGNITVTFPSVQGWWSVFNGTSGAFYIKLASAGGGNVICAPPGEFVDIQVNTSLGVYYRNLDRVGSYIDIAASAVPSWISNCSVAPYLVANGSAFSSSTYPVLALLLGGTTLPDLRGRTRFYLNAGTGRITTASSGIDGDTILSAGGNQVVSIVQANFPAISLTTNISDPGHSHTNNGIGGVQTSNSYVGGGGGNLGIINFGPLTIDNAQTGITASTPLGGSGTGLNKMPPAQISGITLIRAG